ncbi:MAG: hypothetical protein JXB32_11755 [Deltaproteobacteria bacterium]|nr:hypothetical protein [Deltaproteobacteria bacterium]
MSRTRGRLLPVLAASFAMSGVGACGGDDTTTTDDGGVDGTHDADTAFDADAEVDEGPDADADEGADADADADADVDEGTDADADTDEGADADADAGPPVPPSWGTPVPLGADPATDPQAAIDDAGNATVVFERDSGGFESVWALRYEVSSSAFGASVLLETDDTRYAASPDVGMDGAGTAVAIWAMTRTGSPTSGTDLYASERPAAGAWTSPAGIEAESSNTLYGFLGAGRGGSAIAVWVGGRHVSAARFVVGDGWQTEVVLRPAGTASVVYPRVALNDAGDAVAVWTENDGGRTIWSSRFSAAGGTWTAAERLDTIDTADAQYPRPALAADGTALVVWEQDDAAGRASVWANRFDVTGGAWVGAAVVESETRHADRPVLAMDGTGNATCAWVHDLSRLWAVRWDAGTRSWGAPAELATGVASSSDFTDHDRLNIASDSAGNVTVLFETGTGDGLASVRFDAASAAWTTPVAVLVGRGDLRTRSFAMNAAGVALLAWTEDGGSGSRLWAVRLE